MRASWMEKFKYQIARCVEVTRLQVKDQVQTHSRDRHTTLIQLATARNNRLNPKVQKGLQKGSAKPLMQIKQQSFRRKTKTNNSNNRSLTKRDAKRKQQRSVAKTVKRKPKETGLREKRRLLKRRRQKRPRHADFKLRQTSKTKSPSDKN